MDDLSPVKSRRRWRLRRIVFHMERSPKNVNHEQINWQKKRTKSFKLKIADIEIIIMTLSVVRYREEFACAWHKSILQSKDFPPDKLNENIVIILLNQYIENVAGIKLCRISCSVFFCLLHTLFLKYW